jgi:hypothetical protein
MSPEYGRARVPHMGTCAEGSIGPDFVHAQGHGQAPMAEQELVYAPASRAANDNDATPNATDARPSARRHLTPTEVAHYACACSAAELRARAQDATRAC